MSSESRGSRRPSWTSSLSVSQSRASQDNVVGPVRVASAKQGAEVVPAGPARQHGTTRRGLCWAAPARAGRGSGRCHSHRSCGGGAGRGGGERRHGHRGLRGRSARQCRPELGEGAGAAMAARASTRRHSRSGGGGALGEAAWSAGRGGPEQGAAAVAARAAGPVRGREGRRRPPIWGRRGARARVCWEAEKKIRKKVNKEMIGGPH